MSAALTADLKARPLTYSTVGAALVAGPQVQSWSRQLGQGQDVFERAADAVLHWRAQLGAGLRVVASAPHAAVGEVVEQSIGAGRLRARVPCRVVRVVDEPRLRGFAYGTLPGHPETGEEAFLVEWRADDSVVFRISAAAHPVGIARLGGPVTRWVQQLIVRRYLTAVERLSR